MELKPLYRLEFTYTNFDSIVLKGPGGTESQHFSTIEGTCTGRIAGSFRGANHPRRRVDETFMPNMQGVIETSSGALIYFDHRGYGRAYPKGRRQIVVSATHLSDHPDYTWLNDVVCVGVGEVRAREGGANIVLDVAELIWRPLDT